jgi:hypothetical protein
MNDCLATCQSVTVVSEGSCVEGSTAADGPTAVAAAAVHIPAGELLGKVVILHGMHNFSVLCLMLSNCSSMHLRSEAAGMWLQLQSSVPGCTVPHQ